MKVPLVGTSWRRVFRSNPGRVGVTLWVKKIDFETKRVVTVPGPPGSPLWNKHWRYHDASTWFDKYQLVDKV